MIRFLEPLFFASVAVASHVALFSAAPVGLPPSSGDEGRAIISLVAAPSGMATMVETWTAPPEVMTTVAMPSPEAAMPDTGNAAPQADAAPRLAMPAPQLPSPKATADSPATDTAPATPPQALPKPKANPAQKTAEKPAIANPVKQNAASGATPRPAQKAAGTGGKANAGKSGKAKVAAKTQASAPKALAKWHANIRNRIERKKRAPGNCRASGMATLRLKIATSGQLVGLSLAKSSGNAALDKAAMTAAQRARLPAAPRGVTGATTVNLPIRFDC